MNIQLTAVFQEVPEGYIGFVEELPGANTQGKTLQEARNNLEEAVQLVLEAEGDVQNADSQYQNTPRVYPRSGRMAVSGMGTLNARCIR